MGDDYTFTNFIIAIPFAIAIAFISYRLKYLTLGGSVFQFIIAIAIFTSGSFRWSIPILVFFFTSTFITRINSKKNNLDDDLRPITRNQYQVLANGGVSGLLAVIFIFYRDETIYYLFLSSLSVVCSDTWSTEIGTLIKSSTYNILNLQLVEPGYSGGISLAGTLGGILGSVVIALSGFLMIDFNLNFFVIIIASGILGNLLDSLLGSTTQLKYSCLRCNKIVESKIHCGIESKYIKGLRWMNNDTVNFISSVSGILFFILLNKIL